MEFLDLVTACHSFVAAADRAVPALRGRTLGEDERTIVHENVAPTPSGSCCSTPDPRGRDDG
ncbi:conserved hypothetical protein [Streptomyces himastatinicus ATCC 53653]|uniref:Uncharacterized protein n=1 Tax=Streptomyces himastatinicus ATCC 53653 TaxID=457427 RepID=D9WGS2_9ACTN|nr:conserved hypothetical protein [Streptomyces himastatinicus ATCC 53653]